MSVIVKKRRVRSWLTYDWSHFSNGEKNTKPSETVPNQALSIREIFERFASGRPLSNGNGMQFTGDETIDISRMDKTEIAQFRLDLRDQINELKGKLKSEKDDYYARIVEERERADELLDLEGQQKELEARIKKMKPGAESDKKDL